MKRQAIFTDNSPTDQDMAQEEFRSDLNDVIKKAVNHIMLMDEKETLGYVIDKMVEKGWGTGQTEMSIIKDAVDEAMYDKQNAINKEAGNMIRRKVAAQLPEELWNPDEVEYTEEMEEDEKYPVDKFDEEDIDDLHEGKNSEHGLFVEDEEGENLDSIDSYERLPEGSEEQMVGVAANILKSMVKIANYFDEQGMQKEANAIDKIMTKTADAAVLENVDEDVDEDVTRQTTARQYFRNRLKSELGEGAEHKIFRFNTIAGQENWKKISEIIKAYGDHSIDKKELILKVQEFIDNVRKEYEEQKVKGSMYGHKEHADYDIRKRFFDYLKMYAESKGIDIEQLKTNKFKMKQLMEEFKQYAQNAPALYVNVYETDQAYGGAEEGGWWYDTYEVSDSKKFNTEEEAKAYAEQLKQEIKQEKESGNHRRESIDDSEVDKAFEDESPMNRGETVWSPDVNYAVMVEKFPAVSYNNYEPYS